MRTFASDGSEIIKGLEEVGNLCRIYGCTIRHGYFYLALKKHATEL